MLQLQTDVSQIKVIAFCHNESYSYMLQLQTNNESYLDMLQFQRGVSEMKAIAFCNSESYFYMLYDFLLQ